MYLMTVENDPKTSKGSKQGYLTGVQYLAPETQATQALGRPINLCAYASAGCAESCLMTAGRGVFQNVRQARINRTVLFMNDRSGYWEKLIREIQALERKAHKRDMIPVVRLNGTSDILWEKTPVIIGDDRANNIMELFPNVQFMDYTKYPYHKRPTESLPSNYDLTFSRSESNEVEVLNNLWNDRRVAVVFSSKKDDPIPEVFTVKADNQFVMMPVVNGDLSDLRFLDPQGVIVHLYAKGKAKKDTSGFVVQIK
jgi:hypothetical protein